MGGLNNEITTITETRGTDESEDDRRKRKAPEKKLSYKDQENNSQVLSIIQNFRQVVSEKNQATITK